MPDAVGITELVLRDGHQSLFATRMRLEDMLPIAGELDEIGYWSIETWGGATFDSCIRFLGEDPWERLRALKKAMPKTRHQMLFRAQNILGYRHYADDVVRAFVERAAVNGMDVFRIFDAMNDMRNLKTAVAAVIENEKHAQGTLSYTVSPVHTLSVWLDMAKALEDMGVHSICIKDMAGLLKPYVATELVSRLKESVEVPIALHCHATTGLSTASIVKAIEAGVDMVDTSISSMSMTYGHSPTESIVSIFEGHERDTGLDIQKLEPIAAKFREIRKKYAKFEGSLKGVDSRILVAQVPGGMLTNMENQLREQGASDKLDEVLAEIPRVRKDLGYIPLVTPTSQIVGTQAVLNVLMGERYKSITKETAGVLRGEYGATPAPVDSSLQQKVLKGDQPVTCRPADRLAPELDQLQTELKSLAAEKNIKLGPNLIEDTLIYALFPQPGINFLQNRGNPEAFEPKPEGAAEQPGSTAASRVKSDEPAEYQVEVDGHLYRVRVGPGRDTQVQSASVDTCNKNSNNSVTQSGQEVLQLCAPMAGNIFRIEVKPGETVSEGDIVIVLEAMKMETEIRAHCSGEIREIHVKAGDAVQVGAPLLSIARLS